MNKRQHKKNVRKQMMSLSRSELARVCLSKNYKRRKQRLKCIFRLYRKWSASIESQPLSKNYGGCDE